MKTSGNKILIIVLILVVLLAIVGGAFAYAYFCTDIFRSSQELFAKYLNKNLEELNQTLSLNKINELEDKLKQNKYEENMTLSYIESGKTQPDGTMAIDIQKDPISKKTYGIIALKTQKPEETLELEYMHEKDMYSLRFTDVVKQFLSAQNSGLKELAKKLGVNEEIAEQIPDTIDFESFSLDKLKFTNEEKNAEINRYANALYNNIAKEKYTKNKNVVITVNGKTITTNAYILTLNMQDMKSLAIKLLETLKQDEIILAKLQVIDEMTQDYTNESLKNSFAEKLQEAIDELTAEEITEEKNFIITVYEEAGKTVRVKVEQELEYITLDTTEVESKKQIDLNYTNIDENNTQQSNGISFIKENDNNLSIQFNMVDGEEQQTIKLNIEILENNNNIKINTTLEDEAGKTEFSRNINFVEEINYKVTLDNSNNVVLNNLSQEQLASVFTLVGENLNTGYAKKFKEEHLSPFKLVTNPIKSIMMGAKVNNKADETIQGVDLSEAERARFNSTFSAYEGTNRSTAQVNALLNSVFTINMSERNSGNERYVTVSGDVTVEADATSITRVEGSNYYNVQCKIGADGLINEIVITANN